MSFNEQQRRDIQKDEMESETQKSERRKQRITEREREMITN
jgi:hypothetical protein